MNIHFVTRSESEIIEADIKNVKGSEAAVAFRTEFDAGLERVLAKNDEWRDVVKTVTKDQALRTKLLWTIGRGGDIRMLNIAWNGSQQGMLEQLQVRVNAVRRGE